MPLSFAIHARPVLILKNSNEKVTLGEDQAHEVQADAFAMTHALGRTVESKSEAEIVEEAKEIGEFMSYESGYTE